MKQKIILKKTANKIKTATKNIVGSHGLSSWKQNETHAEEEKHQILSECLW